MNEFNRCQTQLKDLYQRGLQSQNEVEFACYQLLYGMYSQQHLDFNATLQSLKAEQLADSRVRLVLSVCVALRREDFAGFFALFDREDIPFQCHHFMKQFFRRVRTIALHSIFFTWEWRKRARNRVKPTVSLELLRHVLHYATFEEALEDLKQFGIAFGAEGKKLDEESCKKLAIGSADGIRMMQEYQQSNAERGAKLL